MTKDEVKKILAIMRNEYDAYYRKSGDITNAAIKVDTWYQVFKDCSYTDVSRALIQYIATDTTGYPPPAGKLRAAIKSGQPMNPLSAVLRIQQAVRNGLNGSAEEFLKLPDPLKRVVGDHSQLKEWAMLSSDEWQRYVVPRLQKAYTWECEHESYFTQYDWLERSGGGILQAPEQKQFGGSVFENLKLKKPEIDIADIKL